MSPAGRKRLDRAAVLSAAVHLADSEGLAEVSMRSLAAKLEVVPMALYKHVTDKDDLIGGMVDTIIEGYEQPDARGSWREQVRERVMAARRALVAHPWLRSAIESRDRRTYAVLDHMEALSAAFLSGGFTPGQTHHVMHALGNRIWGFTPEAFDGGDAPADDLSPEEIVRVMRERYPSILAIAQDSQARRPGGSCDEQAEFEFSLDLLLDAFERLRDAAS